jgi:RNA polymerase sigma factor (sigma-70 family)
LYEEEPMSLVARIKLGNKHAFAEAYRELSPAVYRFLVRLCRRDTELASDLHQETWIRLARNRESLAEDTKLIAWLLTVARNLFISHRRWALLDASRLLGASAAPAPLVVSPEHSAEQHEQLARLEQGLAALSDASREVLLLVCVDEIDQADAAQILGLSDPALRKRLSRARKELEDVLATDSTTP